MANTSDAGSLTHLQAPPPPFGPGSAIYSDAPNAPPENPSLSLGGEEGQTLEDLIYHAEITDQIIEVGDVEGTKEKDKYDQLGSVLVTKEEIPPGTDRKFAENLHENFQICQRFLAVLCRIPIESVRGEDTEVVFVLQWNSLRGILFFFTAILFALILGAMVINFCSTMMNTPYQPDSLYIEWVRYVIWDPVKKEAPKADWKAVFPDFIPYPKRATPQSNPYNATLKKTELRAIEMFVFRRNMASLLIILAALAHIVTCDYKLFRRRKFVASYLSYWAESVEIMKIDAAGDAGKYCAAFLFYYFSWYIIFVVINVANGAPASSGAPVAFVLLWFRCVVPHAFTLSESYIFIFRITGSVIFLFIILCSKAYVFLFLFVCKILKTTCIVWNERLEAVFTIEERKKTRAEKCVSRTGYDHLFKDYVTILDLMSGANDVFTNILESYFSITLISIVFEVYYLVRPLSGSQDEFKEARVLDMIVIGVLLFNSIMIFYLTTVAAAEVSDAAADGLEIIRRQGIMGHRSDEEMHFMISVYMSFTGHFDCALVGGGYFVLNKSFLIGIAGALISYIIIIFQFQPALGLGNDEQKVLVGVGSEEYKDILKMRSIVFHVENTWRYFKSLEPGF